MNLGKLVTILGLVVTVGGPVVTFLLSNPIMQSHKTLAAILALAGVAVTACGIAHDALQQWMQLHAQTQITVAKLHFETASVTLERLRAEEKK